MLSLVLDPINKTLGLSCFQLTTEDFQLYSSCFEGEMPSTLSVIANKSVGCAIEGIEPEVKAYDAFSSIAPAGFCVLNYLTTFHHLHITHQSSYFDIYSSGLATK